MKRSKWIVIIILLAIAVGCTAGDGEPGADDGPAPAGGEATLPAGDPADEENVNPSAPAATQQAVETAAPTAATPAKSDLLVGDDRSDQLKRLTSSWGTNWEKRTISTENILSGGPPRDGIPAIDEPKYVTFAEADGWLADNEPVVALEIDGVARAYPLQVLTWHEIANDELNDVPVAVTFCPLCNSAIVFDRRFADMVLDFGVSGLLRNSDLIMYDRQTESLWQQFTGEGIIGEQAGEHLDWLPSQLISYADFKAAYPEGDILSRDTGFRRSYGNNPYAGYDSIGNSPFLYRGPIDGRLPAVARVVTIHFNDSGIDVAYPYSILAVEIVVNDTQSGQDLAVFWQPGTNSALGAAVIAEAEDVGATAVFSRLLNGETLQFAADGDRIVDEQTNSVWSITGLATEGPLQGEQLEPLIHADHFWFSWAAFRPDTILYGVTAAD